MHSTQIYVSLSGDDSQAGTSKQPLRTIQAALEVARVRLAKNRGRVQVRLGGGMYNLDKTIIIGPDFSGLTLCAEDGQTPVLAGQLRLQNPRLLSDSDLPVAPEARKHLWQVDMPVRHVPQALYVNGYRRPIAMWPKHDRWEEWPQGAPGATPCELRIPPQLMRRSISDQDVILNVLSTPYTRWINYIMRINEVDGERITVSRPLTPNNYLQPAETIPFRVENALEALTEQG